MIQLPLDAKRAAMIFVECKPDQFRVDFAAWLEANWPIWERFCGIADAVWNTGRRHYSARTIVEVMRHETALSEQGGMFKINNNFAPDLARLYVMHRPERVAFFETKTDARAA